MTVQSTSTEREELPPYEARALQIIKLATEQAEEIRALSQPVAAAQASPLCATFAMIEAGAQAMADNDTADGPSWAYLAEHCLRAALSVAQPTQGGDKGEAVAWQALEDTQSLLAMVEHIGPDISMWNGEGVSQQIVDQIVVNRTILAAAPQPASNAGGEPDFEAAAHALGFIRLDTGTWVHPKDDPHFPRRFKSAEAIFDEQVRGVAYAAPELPFVNFQYMGGNAHKEEYAVIRADDWRKFVSSLPSTDSGGAACQKPHPCPLDHVAGMCIWPDCGCAISSTGSDTP